DWRGSVTEGKGDAKAGTGAFTLPVSFPARIGDPGGKTSPEELMAAAHAACYAMALNGTLGRKQASADRTVVRATITADKGVAGLLSTAGGTFPSNRRHGLSAPRFAPRGPQPPAHAGIRGHHGVHARPRDRGEYGDLFRREWRDPAAARVSAPRAARLHLQS